MAFATMPSFSYNKGNEKRGRDSPWIQKDRTYFSTVRPVSEKTKQDKETEETVTTIVKSHKRTTRKAKATREDQYGNLPIHKEVTPLPEEDKYCPYCNSKMEYVTETFVREELRITPAKVERIHYYQEKWQCPECKKDGDGTSAESKTPTALIPHSPASPSIVSYVAMEKIGLAMPYYRQEFLLNQLG